MIFKKIIFPASLLAGAIIGAGMFSLPALMAKTGLVMGLIGLAILAVIVSLLHLLYADVILRTNGEHNFVGYNRIYLGKIGAWLAMVISAVELPLVLVIYLILSVSFSNLLFQDQLAIGGLSDSAVKVFLFWLVASISLFWSVREMARIQFFISVSMVVIAGIIFFFGLQNGAITEINTFSFSTSSWLLLAGPILFALSGRFAVVELVKYFKPQRPVHIIRSSVIVGTIVPAIVYALFVVGILALTPLPTEDAVGGLLGRAPEFLIILVGVLGLAAIWTSYIAILFDTEQVFQVDLRISRKTAIILLVVGPLLLYYFLADTGFVALVAFVGGFLLSLDAALVFLMWWRARYHANTSETKLVRGVPRWLLAILILIFGTVLLNELWKIFIRIVSSSR